MTLMVLGLHIRDDSSDALNGNGNETISPMWRPGFGEETCWFTTCSHGIAYFLYGYKINNNTFLMFKVEFRYEKSAKYSQSVW